MKMYKLLTVMLLGFILLLVGQFASVQAQDNTTDVKIFLPFIAGNQTANMDATEPVTLPAGLLDPALAELLEGNPNQAALPVIIWLHASNTQAELFNAAEIEANADPMVEVAAGEVVNPEESDAKAFARQQTEVAALVSLDRQRAAAVALLSSPVLERLHSLGIAATADAYAPMIFATLSSQQIKDAVTWAEVAQVTLDQLSQTEAESALPTDIEGVSAAAIVDRAKAWVWANQPATAGCYTPNMSYQYNSRGTTNQVCRVGTLGDGQYRVDLPGLGTNGGAVQVVAYGGNHQCKVVNWRSSGTTEQVYVRCFNASSTPTDGRFTMLFYKENRGSITAWTDAYLWADQPTAASYTPSTAYQWNAKGGTNTIHRISLGQYQARLPGLNLLGGTVLVTAYGSGPEHCKVGSWGRSGNDTLVNIYCFNGTLAADTYYTLAYMKDVGLGIRFSEDQHYGGYVWANQQAAYGCYTPYTTYQFNNTNNTNTACRLATGSYRVRLPYLAAFNSTTAQVTAYGTNSEHCAVTRWISDGSGGTYVYVNCYTAVGNPVNSRFTLLYLTDDPILF